MFPQRLNVHQTAYPAPFLPIQAQLKQDYETTDSLVPSEAVEFLEEIDAGSNGIVYKGTVIG